MVQRNLSVAAVALVGWILASGAPAAQPPEVVASIKPVHSLVAGVMAGVGEPLLLLEGTASPHSYGLRPSQAKALSGAQAVFWVGKDLEAFLVKPLEAFSSEAKVVTLSTADGVDLVSTREGGLWDGDHEHAAGRGHEHGAVDMHIWLDPRNADAMVGAIVTTLSELDPTHAAVYQANAAKLRAKLAQLDATLRDRLAPVRDRPYVVFHDAYHYLEDRYGLDGVGSITVDPQRRPGAGRLQEIRARLDQLDAACVFAEPQFEPALVDTVIEGTGAAKGTLDPLGAQLDAGPEQYFRLLNALSDALVGCLGRAPSG